MKTIITTALLFILSGTTGCIAYAHPPKSNPPTNALRAQQVQAWVWINGHYGHGGVWERGYWEIRIISRSRLSRHPRTHIRWVEGRSRPQRPNRRHRRSRR